jgi:tetratricopeptide (TPR) repeat protein/predicted Ser/Thr protein kinase
MERARARTELAMFGYAEPARIGRYQILEPIAGGGMGFVYAAYDPELDRRVALKVLHPERRHDEYAHERLVKEARALARLDHPNVVTVHDVLTDDGEIVIVMELVAGQTLASWAVAAPRSWRDVVSAYRQAGAGLAAAHSLDIIHRDFKPSNAIIGADGRVRVLDFGLARFVSDGPESTRPGAGPRQHATLATASGVILGTLGYAAPEQLAGEPVTAASDQFSFCVALHLAIEGVAPFGGTTVDELISRIRGDAPALASDGRYVPKWLRAVLRRGLTADPAHRYPSMTALLSELGRPRGWKRWRWPAVAALLVVASVVATAELRDSAGALPDCDGGVRDAAAVWGPQHRLLLGTKLAGLGTPYAHEVEVRVLAELDTRTRQWRAVHRAACLDHRHGTESSALLDRKMLCLRERLDDVAAAVTVLDRLGGGDGLTRAVDIVAGIPAARMCADSARLLAEVDPPATPALRARVAAVRGQLSTGAALSRAGRAERAVAAIHAASIEAEGTRYPPVIAEAKLAYGRALAAQGDFGRATPVLRDAMKIALAGNQTRIAVEAAARRIYTEGAQSGDLERLGRDLDFVEAMSESLNGDRFARPLLLNNIGVVYMAAQRRDDALRYFELAHDAMAGDESPDLELAIVDQNIAMLTPDMVNRARLTRATWSRLSARLGEHHLDTLQALMAYASFGADPATAYQLMTGACASYRRMHPTFVDLYVDCESARGLVANELGQHDAAQAAYAAAINAASGSEDPDLIVSRALAAGELALLRGQPAPALANLRVVAASRGGSEHWWVRKDALHAELCLGLAAAATGDLASAIPHLEAAVRGFAEIAGTNQRIVYRLRLASARRALASARSDSPERDRTPRH